jgi:hypothetical protein
MNVPGSAASSRARQLDRTLKIADPKLDLRSWIGVSDQR